MSTPSPLPPSYKTLTLPQITLSHHPFDAKAPTPIIILTLSRPQNRNAFTDTMMESLITAFGLLSRDARVRCIILTGGVCDGLPIGTGKSIFCAGADLQVGFGQGQGRRGLGSGSSPSHGKGENKGEGGEEEYTEANRDGGGRVTLAILACNKPIIAALNGHAIGVGITMTLPCAIRIVSSSAKIGFVFARRGIVMEAASSFLLPRLIGLSRSLHLITTGAVYPASHPLLSDLFSEIVPEERVLGRALEVAEEVVEGCSLVSFALMRDLMVRGPGTVEGAHGLESRVLWEVYGGVDCKEGVEAFLGGRRAVFGGSMEGMGGGGGVWPWWEGGEGKGGSKSKL